MIDDAMKNKFEYKVLEHICHAHWFSFGMIEIYNSTSISKSMNISKYKARKALKALEVDGFIKKDSLGRPAIMSYGEYQELECEAMPPVNGYAITEKTKETDFFKQAEKEYMKALIESFKDDYYIKKE